VVDSGHNGAITGLEGKGSRVEDEINAAGHDDVEIYGIGVVHRKRHARPPVENHPADQSRIQTHRIEISRTRATD
jgi:hypothetical protein